MARLPADEDYARALLAVFKAKKVGARQTLRLSEARAAFLFRNMAGSLTSRRPSNTRRAGDGLRRRST